MLTQLTTESGEMSETQVPPNGITAISIPIQPSTPPKSKLKPLPRNAPRDYETKGKFTIRKGVRIRDYRVLKPARSPHRPTLRSLEIQCRDGFEAPERTRGLAVPISAHKFEPKRLDTRSLIDDPQRSSSSSTDRPERGTRSPSLGTG